MSKSGNLKIALDWTPNTLHSGLYIAIAKGFYKDAGLSVTLLPPTSTSVAPAKLLERGEVDLAICPSESTLAYAEDRIKGNRLLELQAIYTILQRDASAIVSTSPKFSSCSSLQNGAVYGSYGAKYEDRIVRKMINNAGGNGDELSVKSDIAKLSLFDAVTKGDVDATWVFLPWEGVKARMAGTKFNAFRPTDYRIPYGYSPVIARDASAEMDDGVLTRFVRATVQGYSFAMLNLDESVEIMASVLKGEDKEFLRQSMEELVGYFGDDLGRVDLGVMRGEKWHKWVEWLKEEGLVRKDVNVDDLYTNEFFGFRRGSN